MDSRTEDPNWAFQVGANSGDQLFTDKPRVSAKLLRVNTLMVDDPERALKALKRLDAALAKVTSERSRMGAVSNRLGHSLKIAQSTAENLVRSESKIRDADIAKEMMGKVKSDILMQANQLVLAKANANPQGILELLK
ncbi:MULTISPECIES: flagellin [unclassified Sporosarcina]|uniref:flagellin n=1 Tax=unclassified Sporosarcina TaxID=2647733 RepID=UPI00203A5FB8|nr:MULTISPECIES: flagellin [unclassified Sporosarcina]